jgi:hypothetical protein
VDTTSLVSDLIEDGRRVVEQLPRDGFEVTAAFWLKEADSGRWYFYVVSPAYETEGPFAAYMRLHATIRRLNLDWLDLLEVKLIGPTNPIARDVLAIQQRAVGAKVKPLRWEGTQLGNVSVDGAYLYPPPAVASTQG